MRKGGGLRAGLILLLLSAAFAGPVSAQENCWADAALRYGVDPWLLYAIAKQESGLNPGARAVNANGSYDIGLMQINSSHLPLLGKYGVTEQQLYDPCVSIHVGAWLLRGNFRKMGYNWTAVGAYNAGSHDKRVRYAWKIFRQMEAARAAPERESGRSGR